MKVAYVAIAILAGIVPCMSMEIADYLFEIAMPIFGTAIGLIFVARALGSRWSIWSAALWTTLSFAASAYVWDQNWEKCSWAGCGTHNLRESTEEVEDRVSVCVSLLKTYRENKEPLRAPLRITGPMIRFDDLGIAAYFEYTYGKAYEATLRRRIKDARLAVVQRHIEDSRPIWQSISSGAEWVRYYYVVWTLSYLGAYGQAL